MTNLDEITHDWGVRAFGEDNMDDPRMRALRFVEEAVEAAQAAGVPESKLHTVISEVYKRPPGNIRQELGGCMLTLRMLIRACTKLVFVENAPTAEDLYVEEIRRVLSKSPEHYAKRNQEKIDLGLKP